MTSAPSVLLDAAAAAAGAQQYPKAALYVVATPLGNLADLSLRAIHVLALADRVACEDTRVSSRLLAHLGLHKPLLAVHEHNEGEQARVVVAALQAGERVAYVSDAGTPGISDPGARLVAAVTAAGLVVVPVPGPSAVAVALSVAGDVQAEGFRFVGFLPHKGPARAAALQALCAAADACVLYESPHRIEQLARELAAQAAAAPGGAAARRVTVCRELTKQFETVATMPMGDLPAWLAADPQRLRGEFALVLHAAGPAAPEADAGAQALPVLRALLPRLPLKEAVAAAVELGAGGRKEVYRLALAMKAQAGAPADPDDAEDAEDAGSP